MTNTVQNLLYRRWSAKFAALPVFWSTNCNRPNGARCPPPGRAVLDATAPSRAPRGWQCASSLRGSWSLRGGSRRMSAAASGNYSKPQGQIRRNAISSRASSHAGACVSLTVAGIRLLLLRAMRRPKTANVLVQHLNNRSCAGKSSKSQMGDMIEGDMIRIDYFKASVCSLLS